MHNITELVDINLSVDFLSKLWQVGFLSIVTESILFKLVECCFNNQQLLFSGSTHENTREIKHKTNYQKQEALWLGESTVTKQQICTLKMNDLKTDAANTLGISKLECFQLKAVTLISLIRVPFNPNKLIPKDSFIKHNAANILSENKSLMMRKHLFY